MEIRTEVEYISKAVGGLVNKVPQEAAEHGIEVPKIPVATFEELSILEAFIKESVLNKTTLVSYI